MLPKLPRAEPPGPVASGTMARCPGADQPPGGESGQPE